MGGVGAVGRRGGLCYEAVVGVIASIAADFGEKGFDYIGVDGVIDEGCEFALDSAGNGFVWSVDVDA